MTVDEVKSYIDALAQQAANAQSLSQQLEMALARIQTLVQQVAELEAQHVEDERLIDEAATRYEQMMGITADPEFQPLINKMGELAMRHKASFPANVNGAIALWFSPELAGGTTAVPPPQTNGA